MKKKLYLLVILLLLITILPANIDAAVTTTVPISAYSGYTSTNTDFSAWSISSGTSGTFSASFTAPLPTGIKVTGANLYLYGYGRGWYSAYDFFPGSLIFYGQNFSGCPTWGWYWSPYSSNPQINYEWRCFDITNLFAGYAGGTQVFTSSSSVISTNPEWGAAYLAMVTPSSYTYALYKPYVQLTYSYIPAIPQITSPIAGSYYKDTVSLAASSSVTGGAFINYQWYYSIDGGSNWSSISVCSTTNYVWQIPASIPENAAVLIKCRAHSEGIFTEYSAPTYFINNYEPAVAAKIAAEAAKAAAYTAVEKTDEVKNLVNEIKSKMGEDNESPVISDFSYLLDKVRAVRNQIGDYFISAYDNRTPSHELQYRYRINSGDYSSWIGLSSSYIPIDLGEGIGYKQILLEVRDLAGNVVAKKSGIFKL